MSGFLKTIGERWENSVALCALVPFNRVFTGRVPGSEEYPMPYVGIIQGGGRRRYRTNVTDGSAIPISFHIWVDDAALNTAEQVAELIRQVYANQTWTYDDGTVIDALDEGPPVEHQLNEANYKAWEVVKIITMCVETPRVDNS